MELRVMTDLAAIQGQSIDYNAEQIKSELAAFLDKYTGLVVTDENIPEARAARADVNKVRDSINQAKIEAKKAYMAPYARFEKEVKALLAMCDAVASGIDSGIKEYEILVKEHKRAKLLAMFREMTEGIEQYVSFNDVYDPKWLLASAKESDAQKVMLEYAEQSKLNLEAIAQMAKEPADRAALESEYKRSRDLAAVMRLASEIAQRKIAMQRDPVEDDTPSFAQNPASAVAAPSPARVGWADEMTCITVRIWGKNGTVEKILQYVRAMGAECEEVF